MASRLVVEWARTTVRIALAEGEGARFHVRAVRSQPIGQTGEAADALRALLGKRPPAFKQVIGVIPREQVITRVVKFPTMRLGELGQMVELYAKAQLPYPREHAVFDFHLVSQQEGFSTVAVIACQREVVERQLVVLREAGLSPSLLTLTSWGVLGWYRQVREAHPPEPSLVVNVDEHRTDLVLIAKEHILSSRSVGQGMQDWEALGETGELLALEIDRSRAAIRKELPGTEVRSCLLTGLGPLPAWSSHISTRLGLSVTTRDGRQPFPEWTTPMTTQVSPVVVGGLACSDVKGLLNLSPPEMRSQVRHRQQVTELVMVSLLLLGVLALGSGLLVLDITRQYRLAEQLNQALSDVEPQAKQVQAQAHAAQLVKAVLADRQRLATMLSGVFRATPSSITLEAVSFERARQEIVLRGSATSTQDVLEYVTQLGHVEGLSEVRLKYSTRRSSPSGELMDFELALHQQSHRS